MFDRDANAGILFNQFPRLLLQSTKDIKSDSDFLVKLARAIKGDESITHDHQLFRKARADSLSEQDLINYFHDISFDFSLQKELLSGVDNKHLGGWFIVKCMIYGFKQAAHANGNKSLDSYCDFVETLCETEHQFIQQTYGKTEGLELASDFLSKWLLLSDINFNKPSTDQMAVYMIHLVMHWAAIFELFLTLWFGNAYDSVLELTLPKSTLKQSKSRFESTNRRLVEQFKKHWEKASYNKSKIAWRTLYRDVLVAQKQDSDLTKFPLSADSLELVDPDVSAIKKRFQRWQKGFLISIEDFRRYFAILKTPYADSEHDASLGVILFANMFSLVQLELLKAKIQPQQICKLFEEYPKYRQLVSKRYSVFLSHGALRP